MYLIQIGDGDHFETIPDEKFENFDDAIEGCGVQFDNKQYDEYRIIDQESAFKFRIPGRLLIPCICPICEGERRRIDMVWSRDCHGISYRLVCPECWDRILDEKGYDGAYYTAADECLEYDY